MAKGALIAAIAGAAVVGTGYLIAKASTESQISSYAVTGLSLGAGILAGVFAGHFLGLK